METTRGAGAPETERGCGTRRLGPSKRVEVPESVSGAGSDNLFIEGAPSTVSATAQKTDDWGYTLYLGLWYPSPDHGENEVTVLQETETTAEYGVASFSYQF